MQKARSQSGSIVETVLAISALIVLCVFPLIDLLSLAIATSEVWLLAQQTAIEAARQPNYKEAISAVEQQSSAFAATGLAKFAPLTARGGYQNCGVDLYIVSTDYKTGGTRTYAANAKTTGPIDGLSSVYEYRTVVSFNVGPLLNLSRVPGFSQIPGLGKPALLSLAASRYIEHPDSLEQGQTLDTTTVTGLPECANPGQTLSRL